MRLETCIRKGLRLQAHCVREVREEASALVAVVERIPGRRLCCGACGRKGLPPHDQRPLRRWSDLRIRDRRLLLEYAPWRVRCPACGVRVERLPWAAPWQRCTQALAQAVARLARQLSWRETARHFGLDWKTVARVVEWAVTQGRRRRRRQPLHVIGIDEVSRSKGQRYLTLVYDLERARLVWVGENRDTTTMQAFFGWLGRRRARALRVVCCDMWAVYLEAVRTHAAAAQIVFDRFHVVQHLNRALDDVRRALWRALRGEEKSAFKRTRWLWLKNPWNLTRAEQRRLSELCRKNLPLVRAYYLKEAFQRFWDYRRPGWAVPYLRHWLWWAAHSRLEPFQRFARRIREHLDGILAWTELRVANGALEGMNNKIKLVSHRAYGYRKVNTYITAIWHGCGDLPLN
jgi:transposase